VTTYGSSFFRDHVPARSADAVIRLETAGWATVGKTNLHEFAYGVTSQNPHYGWVPNPVAPDRTPGGSSGGSAAALAIDAALGALGTDSGGSIRIPAACCGVVGFKPTHGLVSARGCFPLAPTFDHVGPMARSVATCEEMLVALVRGHEPVRLESLAELTVGVLWTDVAEPAIGAAVERAAGAFARRRRVELPGAAAIGPAFMREVAEVHRERFTTAPEGYGDNVRTKLGRCLAVSDAEYDVALRRRADYREQLLDLFEQVDLLITPSLPCPPPPAAVDELAAREQLVRFTFPFNATGAPALAMPLHGTSVQLAGPPGADALVLAAGRALDQREACPPCGR
jgi:Asp-tRNA(Asn)/Glu-tRNA(Gln) amidotransferase A subunit family amidase